MPARNTTPREERHQTNSAPARHSSCRTRLTCTTSTEEIVPMPHTAFRFTSSSYCPPPPPSLVCSKDTYQLTNHSR
ncbi:hypothetical protein E2C01_090671 [Portunus trituberculatus]|uniref:Uncharacterized protein n=1 Tax=Portunus trituberculatus TaxID=210409 RepID=A0A5B7JKT3_PORTR|nr:hypothetical protein [Portunus trituberculatus]